ncbi:MAG: diacylglycerol/lipid kinase family protein [Bacteroidia bacterium]
MEKKVIFIVNPKAGVKKKIDVPRLIEDNFSKAIPYEIIIWKNKNDFNSIRERIFTEKFTIAVAVGGDGTVNEVAKAVNHTNVVLGVIPFGSGNGLARSIGVPMNAIAAIKRIENGIVKTVDSGLINAKPFFCTSGMGFDAHIGSLFASSTKRGFWTYTKIVIRELFGYKSQEYQIKQKGGTITKKAFLLTFANAGQYGNDFYIAPEANMTDGLLHVVILKPFSLLMAPFLVLKIFNRKANRSRYIETFTATELTIQRSAPGAVHYDGEPESMPADVQVSVVPQSLKVIS